MCVIVNSFQLLVMVTSIFLLNGIPVNTVSFFLALVQTLIAMRSLKEELEMVNGYNTVVCGAHGVACL